MRNVDRELGELVSKVIQDAGKLNELARDREFNRLKNALERIKKNADLASIYILETADFA